jgi:D-alanyl-D-alanine dipeptidase
MSSAKARAGTLLSCSRFKSYFLCQSPVDSAIISLVKPFRFFNSLAILLSITVFPFFPSPVCGQSSITATAGAIEPGPKPPDVSADWKQLVGLYGPTTKSSVTILERDGKLIWLADDRESEIFPDSREADKYLLGYGLTFVVDKAATGTVTQIRIAGKDTPLIRIDAGSDPTHFYHIHPVKPVTELRAAALRSHPPVEPGPFRKPDLVELVSLDPAIHLDVRYATENDFLRTPVYTQARAFMQRPAAEALLHALHRLQPLGFGLLIHDAYRPWYVTKIFWDATPPEGRIFVADPKKGSKHNRGCAVDLTLYDLASGQPIQMPGLYDEMSTRSFPTFPGGTSLQRWHRDLLRHAMESEGFAVNEDEWWHFDYKDWDQYPILNIPFERLNERSALSPK